MARSKTPPKNRNNGPLSDDDIAALQHFHASNIRKALKAAMVKKADYDAARDEVNSHFAKVKGDLLISRKDFEELLAAENMDEAEFVANEQARAQRFARHGLPVGTQLDMFAHAKDTADDEARAYSEGKRAGIRADDPKPPSTISPINHPTWMRGWSDGQAENGEKFIRGAEIAKAREAAKAAAKAKGKLQASPEDEEEDETGDEDGVDADLKKLEAKGWAKPTPAEAEFAPA